MHSSRRTDSFYINRWCRTTRVWTTRWSEGLNGWIGQVKVMTMVDCLQVPFPSLDSTRAEWSGLAEWLAGWVVEAIFCRLRRMKRMSDTIIFSLLFDKTHTQTTLCSYIVFLFFFYFYGFLSHTTNKNAQIWNLHWRRRRRLLLLLLLWWFDEIGHNTNWIDESSAVRSDQHLNGLIGWLLRLLW